MKKLLLSAMVLLATCIAAQAQSGGYLPLVREGVRWHYVKKDYNFGDVDYQETRYFYEFKGDSIFEGKTYKKCYVTSDNPEYNGLVALVREENKRVYRFFVDDKWASVASYDNKPMLIYDFNPSDLFVFCFGKTFSFAPSGSLMIGGKECKRYSFSKEGFEGYSLIEGVGVERRRDIWYHGNLLEPLLGIFSGDGIPETIYAFECLTDLGGNVLYKAGGLSAVSDLKVESEKADNRYYNLQGQPVSNPTQGIYIHNGKKVIVK